MMVMISWEHDTNGLVGRDNADNWEDHMGRFLRTLLGAIFGLVLALAGLLAFKTYTVKTPYDDLWIGINSRMPGPVQAWSCQTVEQRLRADAKAKADFKAAPKGCEALWN